MSVEELGLGLAAVSSLAIPPAASIAVENGARSTLDGDGGSADGDKRTVPLLVADLSLDTIDCRTKSGSNEQTGNENCTNRSR